MKKDKKDISQFRETWGYVYPYFYEHRRRLYLVIFLAFMASLFEPAVALLAEPITNLVLYNPEEAKKILWRFPVGIIVIFTYRAVFTFLSKYLLARLCLQVVRNIQVGIYDHFMFLSMDHYERTTTGEMMARTTNDVSEMHKIVPLTIDVLHAFFQLIGLIAVCVYKQPYLSLIALLAFPLTVYPTQRIGSAMKRYTKKGLKQYADISSIMQETYSGAKVVKAFAREKKEVERYGAETNRLLKIQFKYQAVKHMISPLIGIISAIGIAPVAYLGVSRIIEQAAANPEIVGGFMTYLAAVGMMYNPVRKLGTVFGHFNSAYGAAERIQETLEKQTTVIEDTDPVELGHMEKSIGFDNVSFKYDKEWVLRDFSIDAKKGELVALVGESGSGKTTVVNLLPRFYDVTEGKITIDGTDIKKASLKSLRMQIGVVTQETFLFNDTIHNNILYGSDGKNRQDAEKAARAANAHDFIMKLPENYDTVIGERGIRISGGERQRIAIARALLKDPPILLMDEATSALDTAAEREVQKALDSLMKNRTTFAIAHRLSTIRHADKILVMKQGRIAEQGTHVELMAKNGEYKRLYEMQFFLGEHAMDHYGKESRAADDVS